MGNTFRAVETFTKFVKSAEFKDLPTEEDIVEASKSETSVVEELTDAETFEQSSDSLISQTTDSVDDDAKIIDDSKPDAQLEEVHQIEKDVMEEMKDIEIKHFGEKKSSVRIDNTV